MIDCSCKSLILGYFEEYRFMTKLLTDDSLCCVPLSLGFQALLRRWKIKYPIKSIFLAGAGNLCNLSSFFNSIYFNYV